MKASRWYLPLLLITLALVGLAILFPNVVNEILVTPITKLVWLVLRGFLAIDQEVYWGVLILAVIALVLRVAPIQREKYHSSAYGDLPKPEDRLAYWERLIQSAGTNSEAWFTLMRQMDEIQSGLQPERDENERSDFLLKPPKTGIRQKLQNTWNNATRILNLERSGSASNEFESTLTSLIEKMESSLEIQNGKQDTEFNDR